MLFKGILVLWLCVFFFIVDIDVVCKKNKIVIVVNFFNCV